MIDAGANPDHRDQDGWTPLQVAAFDGNVEMVAVLLAAGADANAMSSNGWTPIAWAAAAGNATLVRMLVSSGADPDVQTRTAETPLVLAGRRGHLGAANELVGAEAQLDLQAGGMTALMWAALLGHRGVVRALLDAGADVAATTPEGRDAAALAERADFGSIVSLLALGR